MSIPVKTRPTRRGKGDRAEAECRGGRFAGRAENICSAVAEMRSAIRKNAFGCFMGSRISRLPFSIMGGMIMPTPLPLCGNLSVGENGHLFFAGQDTVDLSRQYGTPLYLMDEDRIRERCRTYRGAVKRAFGDRGHVLYASKAASFRRMYEIMLEEGMEIDVVSAGEIYTAAKAGFPMKRAWFHSNNKTDEDIAFAMEKGVGHFVVDNREELLSVDRLAGEKGIRQRILLRLTPGIDPHTFEAVSTGKVDSKFGFGIQTGRAEAITAEALRCANVILDGFHCHVGSEVFDSDVFIRSAEIMLQFIAEMRDKHGYSAGHLDLGGGYGVRYTLDQPEIDIAANIAQVGEYIHRRCGELGLSCPEIGLEPGRSIVADAGLTLYTVGMVRQIPDTVNYVSVDGGMTDNIRYALYRAPYTVFPADRMREPRSMRCTLVGRCCESGDVIQPGIELPETVGRGDLIAVCTTGAYNYSMASNYNRIPRPPVVMLRGGESYVSVRRESLEDLIRLDN